MHIRPGRYRHYKGNEYIVLGVALHSETKEPLVVYASAQDPDARWVRPYTMFVEWIIISRQYIPRFSYLEK